MSSSDAHSKLNIRLNMWKECKTFVASLPVQKFTQAELNKKKVLQMVADGRLSAACASLLCDALADPNDENLAKLQQKHPSQDFTSEIPSPLDCAQISVSSELVLKKLRSFSKGSAAGPTGIRASHILNAILVNNQTSALETLTAFVNFLAKGMAPIEVQPFLAGAFLVGLGKKDGGIRPIAISSLNSYVEPVST